MKRPWQKQGYKKVLCCLVPPAGPMAAAMPASGAARIATGASCTSPTELGWELFNAVINPIKKVPKIKIPVPRETKSLIGPEKIMAEKEISTLMIMMALQPPAVRADSSRAIPGVWLQLMEPGLNFLLGSAMNTSLFS